jgi:hypothetical protein
MPTIAVFMKELGCKQFQTYFYYPATHPHVHIGVSNDSLVLSNLYEVRKEITFISLSWGNGGIDKETIELYRRDRRYESLENKKWSIRKKTKFEAGLRCFDRADHEAILRIVNLSTGIGLDYF